MKRLLAGIVCMAVMGSVMAQSSFTIVRPADGSKVREKLRVLIPKNSLEPGSYIGVFLGGKFVEAVVPPIEGDYRVYTFNTKTPRPSVPEWRNGIPDGELKLELVKYEGGDTPRIMDRSSVTVTVGNQMNIAIPAGGVQLHYNFSPGQQLVYRVYETNTVTTLSGLGQDNGSRASMVNDGEISYRILYSVDNTYSNGDSLIRMQNLPEKGKDWAMLTAFGDSTPQQVFDYQMQPIYMRINRLGRAVFGSVPQYFGFSSGGASGSSDAPSVLSWPLPVLHDRPVAPGSNWNATYQIPVPLIAGSAEFLSQVTQPYPMRGEFVSAEWEMGHPCAKIRNSIVEGTRSLAGQQLANAGKSFDDDKVVLDETIYFALDTHKIVKMIRTIRIDRKVEVQQQQGGGAGGAGGGGGAGPASMGMGGNVAGAGGAGPGRLGGGDRIIPDRQRKGLTGPGGMAPGGQAPGGRTLGTPGGGGNTRGGGGGAATKTQYIRHTYEQTFILEQ
jgi:hypothetical protein